MFTNVSSATLRKMIKLSERKEKLMAQIQDLDRQMTELGRGIEERAPASAPRRAKGRASGGKRSQRGALKRGILATLRKAGARGATVSQLSEKLDIKPANLYVWFADTGRRVRGLKKIGPARYCLS